MRGKWFMFGCLTSVVIIVLFFILLVFGLSQYNTTGQKPLNKVSWLKLKMSGPIPEYSPLKQDFMMPDQISVAELKEKIEAAKADPKVKGLILEPSFASLGLASLSELEISLQDFKNSGKPVIGYLESAGNKDYLLASCANKVYMNPSASAFIAFTGIGGKSLYYKDLLDRIGVEMKVIHAGQFKGAYENYSRNEMSTPVRESLEALFDDVYKEMLKKIEKNRNIHFTSVQSIFEQREELFIKQKKALEYSLVDTLAYYDQMLAAEHIEKDNVVNISKYSVQSSKKAASKIAVIYATGTITSQLNRNPFDFSNLTAQKLGESLEKAVKNQHVKAIVLRVNSPGGSALESDKMWAKIKEAQTKKPVYISMGDYAASGGYYISSPGKFVFADPFTITGSIGVVGMFPNFTKLGRKLQLHQDGVQRGKFANYLNPWEPIGSDEERAIAISLQDTYDEFKSRVAEGRKMDKSEVETIAQGRVWSSEGALDAKLVDALGSLEDAVKKAALDANLQDYSVVNYPEQKTFSEIFLEDRFGIDTKAVLTDLLHLDPLKDAYNLFRNIEQDPVQMLIPCTLE